MGGGVEGRLPVDRGRRSRRRSRSAATSARTAATSTTPSCGPPRYLAKALRRRDVMVEGDPRGWARRRPTGEDRHGLVRAGRGHPAPDERRLRQLRRGGAGQGPGRRGLGDRLDRRRRRRARRVHRRERRPAVRTPRRVRAVLREPRDQRRGWCACCGAADDQPWAPDLAVRAADRRAGHAGGPARPPARPGEDRHADGRVRALRLGLVPEGQGLGRVLDPVRRA